MLSFFWGTGAVEGSKKEVNEVVYDVRLDEEEDTIAEWEADARETIENIAGSRSMGESLPSCPAVWKHVFEGRGAVMSRKKGRQVLDTTGGVVKWRAGGGKLGGPIMPLPVSTAAIGSGLVD